MPVKAKLKPRGERYLSSGGRRIPPARSLGLWQVWWGLSSGMIAFGEKAILTALDIHMRIQTDALLSMPIQLLKFDYLFCFVL